MIVLGINPGWDSTAALVVDGQVVAAVEEERLSRVKMHLGFPHRAIPEALRVAGIDAADVDRVTFSFVDYLAAHPAITQLLLREKGFPFDPENPLEPAKMLRSFLSVVREPGVMASGFGKASSRFTRAEQRDLPAGAGRARHQRRGAQSRRPPPLARGQRLLLLPVRRLPRRHRRRLRRRAQRHRQPGARR